MALCLILYTGCSARTEMVPVPQVIREKIPAVLLRPIPAPEWRGKTNGDLLDYARTLEAALNEALARIRAIREICEAGDDGD
ncbi:MAG: Rz1-like lysis system protein LysC [Deltaproteobacteria bacterium]|nr:Rz1-like lysis system protein LysC [Deltaproteobacteria bacterium]